MAVRIEEAHVLLLVIRDVHHVRFPNASHVKLQRCAVVQPMQLTRKRILNAKTSYQPTLSLQATLSMSTTTNHQFADDYHIPTEKRNIPPCTAEEPSSLMSLVGQCMSIIKSRWQPLTHSSATHSSNTKPERTVSRSRSTIPTMASSSPRPGGTSSRYATNATPISNWSSSSERHC